MRRAVIALSLYMAASATFAAGQVEVSFKPLHELSDAGGSRFDGEHNVQTLAAHFKALGARLAEGQTLTIEVLDLDMAGTVKPLRQGGEVRVLKGSADWPTMTLRWALAADGRIVKQAEERVSDMSYLQQPLRGRNDGPTAYEDRLIDRWFDERFGAPAPPAKR